MFILGRPDDPDLWSRVQKESNEFGDLLVCDFVDSYLNLTIKTVMILKFLVDNDVRASYVSKVSANLLLARALQRDRCVSSD